MNHHEVATELGRRITVPGTIGRYQLVAKLGAGGMASAYLAVMRARGNFRKLVVLKIPHDRVALDPGLRPMFLDEARLAARLSHPNVVHTYEVLDEADRTILVMEYLEGKSLGEILRQQQRGGGDRSGGSPDLARAMHLRAIADALSGLHYAHEATDLDGRPLGMVHRDVSPQNLIVTYDGQVKLLDFGIAKAATSSHVTLTGTFKGKLRYMAPEQVHRRALDRRADVFGMGAVLFEAIAFRPLWESVSDVDVVGALLRGEVPISRDAPPGIDRTLHAILRRALAPDPDDRHPTALDLQADLESYLDTRPERLSAKQLGGYVAGLFAAQRSRTARAIQEQIARAMLSAPGDDDGAGDREPPSLPPAPLERPLHSLAPASVDRPAVASPPPTRALAWMGFGAAATVGVAAIVFGAGRLRATAPLSAPTGHAVVAAPPAAPPPAVVLPPPAPVALSHAPAARPGAAAESRTAASLRATKPALASSLPDGTPPLPATTAEPDLGY